MKHISTILFGLLLVISGCTYHSNLKTDVYKSDALKSTIPIKAYIVWDSSLEKINYTAEHIYRNHNVEIVTSPGLKMTFISAMSEVFQDVKTTEVVDNSISKDYKILLYPKFEIRSQAVYIQISAKDIITDDLIDRYEASGNVKIDNPTSATVLSVFNVIPCAMLCTPFIEPIINNIVGAQHQENFESRVAETLKNIVIDMKRDRKLKSKYSQLN